ncbi:MAG TPA: hypothetical protein VF745_07770 [Steroidobacteraceae bacterium]
MSSPSQRGNGCSSMVPIPDTPKESPDDALGLVDIPAAQRAAFLRTLKALFTGW